MVDYLKSKGQNSSFSSRANLASQVGIKNYKGTASQNATLLNRLQSQNKTSPPSSTNTATKPVVKPPTPTNPVAPGATRTLPVVKSPVPTNPIAINPITGKPMPTRTLPVVGLPRPTNPVVGVPTPTSPIVRPPMPTNPVTMRPTPNQPKDNMKTPEPTPNPFEDKINSLESELSGLKSFFENELGGLKDALSSKPEPMFDLSQLTSLLQPQQPQFDMGEITSQFNDMFTKLQNEYNSRLEAMQRMLEQQNAEHQKRYDELMNKFKYNQAQLTPTAYNSGGDGISLFGDEETPNGTPKNTSGTPVGYRQYAQMNDALLRYMQRLWGGGF